MEKPVPTLPHWYLVLAAAKEWGCPPWTITGDDGKLIWWLRYRFVYREKARIAARKK